MRKQFLVALVGVIACAGTLGVSAQSTPKSITIIGCLQRAAGALVLKDVRAGETYRLDTDSQLDWHVGHSLEITGTITDANSNPMRVKAQAVAYISPSC